MNKQDQNINSITKEMKYCFSHISENDQNERLDGDGADERELSRVETICQTGKVSMLGNLPILAMAIICYQEKLSFIFVKHGKHEDRILQSTEQ